MGINFKIISIITIFLILPTTFCPASKGYVPKFQVKKIELSGNDNLSDRAIKNIMLTKESSLFSRPTFHNNLFQDDLESIVQFYRNHGHLDVHITSQIIIVDSVKNKLLLKINISEGKPSIIDKIIFSGNQIFSADELRGIISLKQKHPYNESLLEKDNYNILIYYARKGYIDTIVKPDLKRDKENCVISIKFIIEEGTRVRINDIEIEGLEKTKPIVVHRELLIKPEMVFDYIKMLESQHRLYRTGLFKDVSIKPIINDSTRPELRNIKVNITEKENGEINFGVGFGSYDRLRGSTEVFHNNFQGKGNQIGSRLRVSYILQRFDFLFTNPWLFGTKIKFDLNTFIEHKVEPNYELKDWGGTATIGKNVTRFGKITLTYKYQDVNFSHIKDPTEIKEENKGNIRSLKLSSIRDSRDSQFNATKGSYIDLKLESAGGFLKGTHTFFKLTGDSRFFFNVKKSPLIILGSRLYLGWMDNFGKSLIIPLNERFYAGGDGSIRGYGKREVGPKESQGHPVGGKVIFISNIETRFPIYKKFGATVFWDMGNVWRYVSNINPLKIRHGMGVGLRYNSPLGILRVDAGIKLNRQANESIGDIYFTLGQIF